MSGAEGKRGVVTRIVGPVHDVLGPEGICHCTVRGRMRLRGPRSASPVAVGDEVLFDPSGDGTGAIAEVLPRRSLLSRRVPAGDRRDLEQVLLANMDQVLVVVSRAEPRFSPFVLDRFLVVAELGGVQGLICVNKSDLPAPPRFHEHLEDFRRAGYRVLEQSARTGAGVEELRTALRGQVSALIGHSGVGKSSLLNAVQPGLGLKVGELRRQIEKGRHTTSWVALFPLAEGGLVADTPGLREIGFWNLAREQLASCFPELRPYAEACRFRRCLHGPEPGCAVKEAVQQGEIPQRRYEGYCRLLESL